MSFALSKSVNPPTVFLASLSELGDRFDPEMVLFRRKTHSFKFPVRRLCELFSEPPQYGAGERGLERESNEQPRYVRITDIDEYGLLTHELGATAANVEPRYILKEGDLLFARSGNTVGKTYLHKSAQVDYPCFFAGYLIRLRFDATQILPDFVFALTQLPYYKGWVEAVQRAAGQPNINAQEYSNLRLPCPPLAVQEKIISKIHAAYSEKRRHEDEARNLLNNCDTLLLKELGITPKPAQPNTLQHRIFRRAFSSVAGGRFDAPANWKDLSLKSKLYPACKLTDLVSINPLTCFDSIANSQSVSFVPMDAVSETFGEISDRHTRVLAESGSYTPFREGDLIWAKITPCMENGKSAVAENLENGFGFGSTEFHVFRPKHSGLSIHFLHALFRMKLVREHARLFFGGSSGHQRVDEEFFKRLEIPLPPVPVQEKIATAIKKVRTDAHALRRQAAAELDAAKKEIEAMILGKEGKA